MQNFSERHLGLALLTYEQERNHFPGLKALAGAHTNTDEREYKLALIFCAHHILIFI